MIGLEFVSGQQMLRKFVLNKINDMKTILLLKEVYVEGFRNLGNFIIKKYFKLFAWFSFAMFIIVLYAFIYRVVTGFAFD